jgi:hypothetical protein
MPGADQATFAPSLSIKRLFLLAFNLVFSFKLICGMKHFAHFPQSCDKVLAVFLTKNVIQSNK